MFYLIFFWETTFLCAFKTERTKHELDPASSVVWLRKSRSFTNVIEPLRCHKMFFTYISSRHRQATCSGLTSLGTSESHAMTYYTKVSFEIHLERNRSTIKIHRRQSRGWNHQWNGNLAFPQIGLNFIWILATPTTSKWIEFLTEFLTGYLVISLLFFVCRVSSIRRTAIISKAVMSLSLIKCKCSKSSTAIR